MYRQAEDIIPTFLILKSWSILKKTDPRYVILCTFLGNIIIYHVMSFTLAPSGTINNLTVTTTSLETIEVNWDPIELFGRRGLISHYVIEFFQHAHPWEEILYEDGITFNRTSLVSNFTLTPVPNNTWFNVNVYGVTRVGDGPTVDTSVRVLTQENGK